MLADRVEHRWIESFLHTFRLSNVTQGDEVAILSESQSRPINMHLAELALLRLGAKPYHIQVPTPAQSTPVPVRSSGASFSLQGIQGVIQALASASMVVDLTVEGLLHAPELPRILEHGSRVLYVSNEHPEALERLGPIPGLKEKVQLGTQMFRDASWMRVRSAAGTDLHVHIEGARTTGGWGYADAPGRVDHWPGGLVVGWPPAGGVNGTLVLARGDLNLTFKRYVEDPVTLIFENDIIVSVQGDGLDAALTRAYLEAWNDPNVYGSAHIGWGMNPHARWESMTLYDKIDTNGTEQRAFAGNFMISTGANKMAGRYTLGHFDLPMRHCTVELDGRPVVQEGRLIPELTLPPWSQPVSPQQ